MRLVERTNAEGVTVAAPPSKAHTLRALLMASLADGEGTVRRPLLGEDQCHVIECLRGLGVRVEVDGEVVRVEGCGGTYRPVEEELNLGESGVGMNFLSALTCLCERPVTLTGAPGLLRRPVSELVAGLEQLGCRIDYLGKEGFPPLRVTGGGIPGGRAAMSGALTSQYFSAVLTAAPCARAPVSLECKGALTEAPYLEITLGMLAERGVAVEREAMRRFAVPAPVPYRAIDYAVEGDYSSAAFFFEAAAACGIGVTVTGLPAGSQQGDRRMTALLERMGCAVRREGDAVTVSGAPLRAIEADMTDVPDLVPPLAVTAAFAEGTTRLSGIAHLRHKESDRPAAIVSELAKMGIRASCDGPALSIEGGRPRGAEIDPHNDHRIAMSFAVAGLAVGGQAIRDPGCVAKSFPDFWERLAAFGA